MAEALGETSSESWRASHRGSHPSCPFTLQQWRAPRVSDPDVAAAAAAAALAFCETVKFFFDARLFYPNLSPHVAKAHTR